MEKPLAMQAGLGWQGKHTVLVSRDFGNWLFLGVVYSTLALAPDPRTGCRSVHLMEFTFGGPFRGARRAAGHLQRRCRRDWQWFYCVSGYLSLGRLSTGRWYSADFGD